MLAIFAVIIGGIVTGRLLVGWRLAFVQRLITFIIWALLFLLGVEVGSDPAVVGEILTATGVAAGEVLYVGDSGVDMQTAAAAGVRSAGVTWGFRTRAELEQSGARHIVDRPAELLGLL